MRLPVVTALTILLSLAAADASAALSKEYSEWRNGPAQWIMTSDEQRAWKAVKTDAEALRFVNLFWARRDPSEGTPQNEYRTEFENRVRTADAEYAERGRKGSMSDRGRAFIILGPPSSNARGSGSLGGGTGTNTGAARATGASEMWTWTREEALTKFDMPKTAVAFTQDPITLRWTRDVTKTDFIAASAAALRKALVRPDLTDVPSWAAQGGLDSKIVIVREVPFDFGQPAAAPKPATAAAHQTPSTPAPAAPATPANVDPATASLTPRGASNFVLLYEAQSIETETKIDPFSRLKPISVFKSSDELGWVAQYCTAILAAEEPSLRFTLRMTGTAAGEVIDRAAPPDEMIPDRIRVRPGCYLLRGGIPLEGMSPGSYELEVTIEDPSVQYDLHRLKQPFTIE